MTSNVGTVTLNDGDVLPFDTVIQGNLSGNFDISNSSYTANIQGRYMFTITYTYVTGSNGGPAFTLNGQDILYCPTGITTGPLNSCFTYNVMPGDVIQVIHTGPPIIYNFLPLYSIFTVDLM